MSRIVYVAYHGAKNSTSIREALLTKSSKLAAVSLTTSEGTSEGASDFSPSAKTNDARARANAGERNAERRMIGGRKRSGLTWQIESSL
jgi:hypothetical protein